MVVWRLVIIAIVLGAGAAHADSKAINVLAKKGGVLDTANSKGKGYVDAVTNPGNADDPGDIANNRAKDFARASVAAAKAATNVPGTSLKGSRPGIFGTIWFAIKSLFGLASATSGTSPSNKLAGFDRGLAVADAAVVSFNGAPLSLASTFDVPFQFAAFTDAFGSARVALYDFDFTVTSALTDIAGGPFLHSGDGGVVSAQLLDLSPEFGFEVPQYQLVSFADVPSGAAGTYTIHVEGWAATDIPEPAGGLVVLTSLSALAAMRRLRIGAGAATR